MFTRISERLAVAALLMLAGCDGQGSTPPPPDPKAPDTVICQIAGAARPEPLCRRENAGDRLTIRHPDGGFRRFVIVDDGRGIITADGADGAKVEPIAPGRIRVTVDQDRYELPATLVPAK